MRRSILVAVSLLGIGGILPAQEESKRPQDSPKVGLLDFINEVEGTTRILKLAPEGKWVKAGDVIATLDSAKLRDRLIEQEILTQETLAAVEVARLAVTDAELDLKDSLESGVTTQVDDLKQGLKLAEDELSLRNEELAAIEKLERVTPLGRHQATFKRDQAELAAARLRRELEVLQSVRKVNEERQRNATLTKARRKLLAASFAYELQKAKEDKLRHQIQKCRIESPADGVLIHPGSSGISSSDAPIEVGSKVRESQLLLRLVCVSFE